MPYRSTQVLSPGLAGKNGPAETTPLHTIALSHDQRHLRRKLLHLDNDDVVMLDLKEAVMLADGDLLVLDSGDHVRISAIAETLYEIRPRDALHLIELAWHLGNRHLPAEVREDRILILRDAVIKSMLEGLGATVSEVVEPFQPMRGAYHGGGGHSHGHGSHSHAHDR